MRVSPNQQKKRRETPLMNINKHLKQTKIMKLRNILLSSMVAMGCTAAVAQEAKTEEVFEPHAYLMIQGGYQYTLGELGYGDLLSPNFQLGIGYNFNKVVGARFSVNAWQSKAGQTFNGVDKKWKWNYAAPMVDATFNLTNLFCKYNPNRLVNVSVFGGVGANIAWGNDEANTVKAGVIEANKNNIVKDSDPLAYAWDGTKVRLAARVGANVDFRVSDRVSLGLEVSANTLNDHYNSKKADNADWYFNTLVGAKIALGKTHSTRKVEQQAPIERVIERVVEKQVPAPTTQQNFNNDNAKKEYAKENGIRRDVFFTIGKFNISDAENRKIDEIVDYMKANPSARVVVTGYADKGTGSVAINRRIAAQRADAVTKILLNKGISKSRIATDSKGSDVQPFDNNDDNRVTICIAK